MSGVSKFLKSGDLKIHYLQYGEPQGIAVVLLHGLRGYAQTWESLINALGDRYCCYALDQRGRGDSDWGPVNGYHTDTYVADLEAFVEHAQLDEFILIGHSLGGTNALEFTRKHPDKVKALVIEDIGPGSSNQGDGAARIRREMRNTPFSFSSWGEARAFWLKSRPNLTETALDSRLRYSLKEADNGVVWKHDQEGIAQARLTIEPIDLWPSVKAVNCPAFLVKGGNSDFLPYETVTEVLRINHNFSSVVIDGASHYAHDDQPEVFNREVVQFVNAINN